MSVDARVEALRTRLRGVGVATERLDDAAIELAARLAALECVTDERLEGVAPATVFAPAERP